MTLSEDFRRRNQEQAAAAERRRLRDERENRIIGWVSFCLILDAAVVVLVGVPVQFLVDKQIGDIICGVGLYLAGAALCGLFLHTVWSGMIRKDDE